MKFSHLLTLAGVCAVLLSGCGAQDSSGAASESAAMPASAELASDESGGGTAGKAPGAVGATAQTLSQSQRKIIYTATVDLIVENLTTGQTKLARLVRANNAYIAETNVGGASGETRNGTWKVRVPVEKYESFMDGASRLGELQRMNSSSEDVTAEFTDVSARIKNKQIEERRLQDLLKKATGKLTEILQVEKEISRVRGEIEQLQGRIRVLSNLSSLSTVTISMNEIKDYVPPAPPTFGTEIARQFEGSVSVLKAIGKGLVLLGVALAPWLPFVLLGFLGWRLFARKKTK